MVFELARFCQLAQAGNPNALELFWAPELHSNAIWQELQGHRHLFISQLLRQSYSGYAHSQLKKLLKNEENHPERSEKREKSARHLFRLFEQGQQLLTSGELRVQVADPQEIITSAKAPALEIKKRFKELDEEFQELVSPLPELPDYQGIEKLLRSIRLQQLDE